VGVVWASRSGDLGWGDSRRPLAHRHEKTVRVGRRARAALYLYSGIIDAVRTRGGFQSAPTVLDNVGIIINGLMPAVACAIAAVWYQRQRSASVTRV
jgi:hypothetical protein